MPFTRVAYSTLFALLVIFIISNDGLSVLNPIHAENGFIPDRPPQASDPRLSGSANCHRLGPIYRTNPCHCKRDAAFVIRPPLSTFEKRKHLLILDIDETILSSTSPIIGLDLWNDSNTYLAGNMHAVWQYGFELFYIDMSCPITSLIRPGFFDFLDYAIQHDFNVILYTRGKRVYGAHLNQALPLLYLKWKQQQAPSLNISEQAILNAHSMIDMVIANDGAGKTFELINDYVELNEYDSIFVLDDAKYHVWCMQYAEELSTQYFLIAPQPFMIWQTMKSHLRAGHALTKQMYVSWLNRTAAKDDFFKTFTDFLRIYLSPKAAESHTRPFWDTRDLLNGFATSDIGQGSINWWQWKSNGKSRRERHADPYRRLSGWPLQYPGLWG